jgi:hypothetical protein
LAERCASANLQISIASIKRAESGKNILYRIVGNLASFFDVPISDFLDGSRSSEYIPNTCGDELLIESSVILFLKIKNTSKFKKILNFISNHNYGVEIKGDVIFIELYGDVHGLGAIEKARRFSLKLGCEFGGELKLCIGFQDLGGKYTSEKSKNHIINDLEFTLNEMSWGDIFANESILKSGYFLENIQIANVNKPLYQWKLTSPLENSTSLPVGRHWEINQYNYLVEYRKLQKDGLTIYIAGSAGMGKTHLINYFYKHREEGGGAIYFESGSGECGTRVSSCGRFCFSLLSLNTTSDEAVISRRVNKLKLPVNVRTWLVEYLLQNDAYSAVTYKDWHKNIGVVLNSLLEFYVGNLQSAIFIDDIHIINNTCENFLPFLVTCIKAFPVMLILAGRNVGSLSHLPAWLNQAYMIQLRSLNLEQLTEISEVIGKSKKLNDVNHNILVRAEGNPRLLRQLMYCSKPDIDIPDSMSCELSLLISNLGTAEVTALKIISLLNENFSVQQFYQCFSRLLRQKFSCALHVLVTHGLLKLCGDTYVFQQPIVRQIMLGRLELGEKSKLLEVCGISVEGKVVATKY